MPLLDHFHPPLYPLRRWESFHARWAGAIADSLNASLLPKDYFAEIQAHVGSRVEIDVATMHDADADRSRGVAEVEGGVATLDARPWAPPLPTMSIPAIFPDSIEVLVYSMEGGATVVAAVELVSLGNQDRHETRRAFAAKCAAYLQQGIGLIVVDVVTERTANLHNELIELLEREKRYAIRDAELYAVSYRPIRHSESDHIDLWVKPLAIGSPLPLLPLALDKGQCVPLDLEAPYMEAVTHSRLL